MTGKGKAPESSPEDEEHGIHGGLSAISLSPSDISSASFISLAGDSEEATRRKLDLKSLSEGVAALIFPSVGRQLCYNLTAKVIIDIEISRNSKYSLSAKHCVKLRGVQTFGLEWGGDDEKENPLL